VVTGRPATLATFNSAVRTTWTGSIRAAARGGSYSEVVLAASDLLPDHRRLVTVVAGDLLQRLERALHDGRTFRALAVQSRIVHRFLRVQQHDPNAAGYDAILAGGAHGVNGAVDLDETLRFLDRDDTVLPHLVHRLGEVAPIVASPFEDTVPICAPRSRSCTGFA